MQCRQASRGCRGSRAGRVQAGWDATLALSLANGRGLGTAGARKLRVAHPKVIAKEPLDRARRPEQRLRVVPDERAESRAAKVPLQKGERRAEVARVEMGEAGIVVSARSASIPAATSAAQIEASPCSLPWSAMLADERHRAAATLPIGRDAGARRDLPTPCASTSVKRQAVAEASIGNSSVPSEGPEDSPG
eukprot:CAMPEP_0179929146 /NCGR_PEP_ID=MMETSP0983-20121128/9253_1 /TAXON_ID=483367 /ORGANISM="non described non described, Strain CCMP 2436" /LENGTH=191 /DNA_ID=CAMNT_0021833013 /DNA_START=88 /DNA_END=664 /DNA_ORIENTATION=+